MSYILDALRKADAERARGAVPGLASQPLPAAVLAPSARRVNRSGWVWAAGGLGGGLALALAALAGWLLVGREGRDPVAAPIAMPGPAASVLPSSAPGSAGLPTVQAAPPVATIALPPAPPAEPQGVRAGAPTSPASAIGPARPATARAVPAEPPASAASGRLPSLAELPEATRRQLPPLRVGGSVWSEQPASRFVMIDGQLLREGESLAPGVVVESIGPRAARLAWRGQRFELRW